jgi:2-oxo-4-hydroxy-4-carboxy--5-ureidoimidazoline (OHCU) decarboxylase
MAHSDLAEDAASNKEKTEEIQQAQAGPAVTDQVYY